MTRRAYRLQRAVNAKQAPKMVMRRLAVAVLRETYEPFQINSLVHHGCYQEYELVMGGACPWRLSLIISAGAHTAIPLPGPSMSSTSRPALSVTELTGGTHISRHSPLAP